MKNKRMTPPRRYWTRTGLEQGACDRLTEALPVEGPASTAELERFRVMSNIYSAIHENKPDEVFQSAGDVKLFIGHIAPIAEDWHDPGACDFAISVLMDIAGSYDRGETIGGLPVESALGVRLLDQLELMADAIVISSSFTYRDPIPAPSKTDPSPQSGRQSRCR